MPGKNLAGGSKKISDNDRIRNGIVVSEEECMEFHGVIASSRCINREMINTHLDAGIK